jgi:hypothetical protein
MIHSTCAVKFFPCGQLAEARAWIEENTGQTHETTAQRDSS